MLRSRLALSAAGAAALFALACSPAPVRAAGPSPAVHLPSRASAAAPADTAALRLALEEMMRGYPGVAGVSVRNLRTGEAVSIRGGETFPSASLIKTAVLVTLLDEVRKGSIGLDERVTMIRRDRVPGSGILFSLDGGLQPTVGDLARMMISLSDNTATNLLLDKLNIRTVWAKMDSLGLPHTRIHSKVYLRVASVAPDSSAKYGLGVTTPDEMVRLFALLDAGRAVSPALDSLALAMFKDNQDFTKLTRWLPENTVVAHKTGEVDAARNDCGIVYGPDAPVAICVMTRENRDTSYAVDNPAHLLIARISREVFRRFNPSAQLPPLPVI